MRGKITPGRDIVTGSFTYGEFEVIKELVLSEAHRHEQEQIPFEGTFSNLVDVCLYPETHGFVMSKAEE